jgi:hypothetical protein
MLRSQRDCENLMYEQFKGMRNLVKTETNSRIFLDDPKLKDGQLKHYVSYVSHGTMEVITQPPIRSQWAGSGPLYMLPWYIENMRGEGTPTEALRGPVKGPITVVGSPELMTTGVIRQNVPGQEFPATLEASVFQVFDIPGYGKLYNRAQVVISAIVDGIPPFEALCRCSAALLYDGENNIRGLVDGRALTILPS